MSKTQTLNLIFLKTIHLQISLIGYSTPAYIILVCESELMRLRYSSNWLCLTHSRIHTSSSVVLCVKYYVFSEYYIHVIGKTRTAEYNRQLCYWICKVHDLLGVLTETGIISSAHWSVRMPLYGLFLH